MQTLIQALPCSSYKVQSGGEEITMVSVVFPAPPLFRIVADYKSLAELRRAVSEAFERLAAEGQEFSLRVKPMSRKLKGYDQERWNKDFTK